MYKKDGTIDNRYKTGLSHGQLDYLKTLYKHEGVCVKAWHEKGFTRQAGEDYVRILRQDGYVTKEPYSKNVTFTKKALDIIK